MIARPDLGFAARPKSVSIAVIAVVALAVSAGVAVGISALTRGAGPHPVQSHVVQPGKASGGLPVLGVDPFHGTSVTLDQLVADIPWVRLPDVPLASSANVGGAWEYTAGGAIVYYTSGIELVYDGGNLDYTGTPDSEIQTIGAARAIVEPAGTVSRFARVMVPLPGAHHVTLYSSGPVKDLTAVAAALVPTNS